MMCYQQIHLTINKPVERFPKIWKSNIQYMEGYRLTDKFPDHSILNYPIENFRIYINNKDYFLSKLPRLNITTDYWIGNWNYIVCFSVYCAAYCCGIWIQHLTPSEEVFPIMRFHLYFTVRRMDGGEKMSDISREFSANKFY